MIVVIKKISRESKLAAKLLLAFSLSFLTLGCGGGGGDSTAAPIENIPTSPVEETEEIVITPTASPCDYIFNGNLEEDNEFITHEYCNTPGLALIKASSAYVAGATGAGVKIAVVDSGINKLHQEFSGKNLDGFSLVAQFYSDYWKTASFDIYNPIGFNQIESFQIINRGSGYDIAPTVTVNGVGDFSGVEAIVALTPDFRDESTPRDQVDSISMTQGFYGENITYATATVDNSGTLGSGLEIGKIVLGGDDIFGNGSFIAGIIGANKDQTEKHEESSSKNRGGLSFRM